MYRWITGELAVQDHLPTDFCLALQLLAIVTRGASFAVQQYYRPWIYSFGRTNYLSPNLTAIYPNPLPLALRCIGGLLSDVFLC